MSSETERRLMEAAGEIFAEKGFEKATVREICTRAGVNVAAIHYHFGDKLGLYKAVLVGAFGKVCDVEGQADGQSETRGGDDESSRRPEARLRSFVLNRLRTCRPAGGEAWPETLVAREMREPTDAFRDIVLTAILPLSRRLMAIVRELLGEPPAVSEPAPGSTCFDDSRQAVWCCLSIVGQCLHHHHAKSVIDLLFPQLTYSDEELQALADQITAFSLAGIEAVRQARQPGNAAGGLGEGPEDRGGKEPGCIP